MKVHKYPDLEKIVETIKFMVVVMINKMDFEYCSESLLRVKREEGTLKLFIFQEELLLLQV